MFKKTLRITLTFALAIRSKDMKTFVYFVNYSEIKNPNRLYVKKNFEKITENVITRSKNQH